MKKRSLVPVAIVVGSVVAVALVVAMAMPILAWLGFFVDGVQPLVIGAVHKVLGKHAQVHEERHQTACQPAKVDKHVLAIDSAGLAVVALSIAALGLVRKDGQHICNVAKASKQEEEHAKSFRSLASIVENQLRQSRCNVRHSAQVAKDLAHDVEVESVTVVFGVVWLGPLALLLSEEPSEDSSRAYHEDNGRVPKNGLQRSRRWRRLARRFGDVRNSRREAGPVCTMTALAAMVLRARFEEGSSFGRTVVRLWCRCRIITPCESTVVEALGQQYNVCQGIVDGQNNLEVKKLASKVPNVLRTEMPYHCRQNALHDGADNVEDISEQPDNDELDREGICAATLEVLNNLRREDDNYKAQLESCTHRNSRIDRRSTTYSNRQLKWIWQS